MDFNPSIPGVFQNITVPTPLASGGVDLYINDSLKYTVIDKVSDEAFQSLWIEIQLPQKSNIIFTPPEIEREILLIPKNKI